MKVSEAMVIGSQQSRQIKGQYLDGCGGACAWGAVLLAHGVTDVSSLPQYVQDAWKLQLPCPMSFELQGVEYEQGNKEELFDIVMGLNDGAEWTVPRIAEWIASHDL